MDKPKKQKKKIIEMPPYNDPMNKEGEIPTDVLGSMAGTGWLIGHIAGITVDGVKLEGDWLRNDGAVPVKSALYPEGEKYEFIVDHEGAYERGVWYVYPVVENANHSTLLGSKTESYIDLYMNQIDIVDAK